MMLLCWPSRRMPSAAAKIDNGPHGHERTPQPDSAGIRDRLCRPAPDVVHLDAGGQCGQARLESGEHGGENSRNCQTSRPGGHRLQDKDRQCIIGHAHVCSLQRMAAEISEDQDAEHREDQAEGLENETIEPQGCARLPHILGREVSL